MILAYAYASIYYPYRNGWWPAFDVLLSLLEAKLQVAEVLAEPAATTAVVKCSVLWRQIIKYEKFNK